MNAVKTFVLLFVLASAAGGCAHSGKNHKSGPTTMMSSATTRPSSGQHAAAPAVPGDQLAGEWTLAMPRHPQEAAKITFTDETHLTIEAGKALSGNYVVQGDYLL